MKKKIREWMLNYLLKKLGGKSYQKLRETEVKEVLKVVTESGDRQKFIEFLNQSAEEARNKFMYSEDKMYKGMALAFVLLREAVEDRHKQLLDEEKKRKVMKEFENVGRPPRRGATY